jgi:hypothetical protein
MRCGGRQNGGAQVVHAASISASASPSRGLGEESAIFANPPLVLRKLARRRSHLPMGTNGDRGPHAQSPDPQSSNLKIRTNGDKNKSRPLPPSAIFHLPSLRSYGIYNLRPRIRRNLLPKWGFLGITGHPATPIASPSRSTHYFRQQGVYLGKNTRISPLLFLSPFHPPLPQTPNFHNPPASDSSLFAPWPSKPWRRMASSWRKK